MVWPPKAAQRREVPPLENYWAAEGGLVARGAAFRQLLGCKKRLSGAKRRLLKMIAPPKEAQWREVPPFENGLAANGGVAARSAVFIKWFGRLFKIILSPFENCWAAESVSGTRSAAF